MEAFSQRPLILGHRGAREEAPENTLPAFQRALELGADGVELDVRLTADGQVVVLHDASLERTTDGRGRVDEATLEDLRRLDAGSWFGPAFAGTRLCTLREALQVLAGARLVNIELKGPAWRDQGLESRVLEVIREVDMEDRVVISSFSPIPLQRLRQLAPEIALAWLHGPGPAGRLRWWLARSLQLQALHPFYAAASEHYLHQAHRQGLLVVPWTVNEKERAHDLVDWGVDGIITDRPGSMKQWLAQEKGQQAERPKGPFSRVD